jgi:hypothetical protein
MDSPGGDICQAEVPTAAEAIGTPASLASAGGSITSSSAIALYALTRPVVIAFNSNGWWVGPHGRLGPMSNAGSARHGVRAARHLIMGGLTWRV